jgi:hypothetical protein
MQRKRDRRDRFPSVPFTGANEHGLHRPFIRVG